MEHIINEGLVVLVAVGATLLGLMMIQPLRPNHRPVGMLRKIAATWLFAYAFVILFLQTIRPPFSQSIALIALAGVFWLLDAVTYESQTQRRSSDAGTR